MAVVRDPAFWRRFSMAVHLDEEQNTVAETKSASSNEPRPQIKHSESWLERSRKKSKRSRCIGWIIAIIVVVLIVAIVLVVLWLTGNKIFKNL